MRNRADAIATVVGPIVLMVALLFDPSVTVLVSATLLVGLLLLRVALRT